MDKRAKRKRLVKLVLGIAAAAAVGAATAWVSIGMIAGHYMDRQPPYQTRVQLPGAASVELAEAGWYRVYAMAGRAEAARAGAGEVLERADVRIEVVGPGGESVAVKIYPDEQREHNISHGAAQTPTGFFYAGRAGVYLISGQRADAPEEPTAVLILHEAPIPLPVVTTVAGAVLVGCALAVVMMVIFLIITLFTPVGKAGSSSKIET